VTSQPSSQSAVRSLRLPPTGHEVGRVAAKNLAKRYVLRKREVQALDDMTIDVAPGEFVALIGPSGCGKTTFLNIVAGFERPTSGEIAVDGRPVRGPGPDRGVVFQDYALFPWLTVLNNVRYGLRERGLPKDEATEIASRWIRQVGLDEFAEQYPHQLSGGMRQRVALIRVLVNEPKILLMDEPFAARDAMTRTALQGELVTLWERSGQTVIYVTHNVEEAIFLADRMVIMSRRPSRVSHVVEIDLPRPRDVTSVEFNQYRRRATELLDSGLSVNHRPEEGG
jgi:ABC-type nitrate/sulfonate/bicarbonate transport system ATPase subunit